MVTGDRRIHRAPRGANGSRRCSGCPNIEPTGDQLVTNPKAIIGLGVLATFGAFIGVLADVFSAWSPNTNQMATAFSVGLDNISGLYDGKPRWTYVLGNYLGVYFIPLHILGFFLIFLALKPASLKWARVFLALGLYLTPIGVGLHGTLAFVGDIIQLRDAALIDGIRDYWQPWAYSVAVGYAIVSALILMLILTGRSLYPRWAALVSPLLIAALTAVAIAFLPASATEVKAFLSLTGLNLPLMIFFPITTWVLVRHRELSLSL
jgi:hypothetical protein